MKPLKKYNAEAASPLMYLVMYIAATVLLVVVITSLAKDLQQGHVGMSIVHSLALMFVVSFGGIALTDWAQYYHEDAFWYFKGFTPLIFHMCFVWTITYHTVQAWLLLPS